jgi:hypothetical protein
MNAAPDIGAVERRLAGTAPVYGVLARVKNECDVIEAFVRHHASLVDRVIVVDNASQDGTREILDALAEEGLPLTVLSDETIEYRQGEIMSYLARAGIRGFELDRVFLLDADEFLHVASRGALEGALASVHSDAHVRMPWITYVPDEAASADAIPVAMRKRRRREPDQRYKIALAASFAESPSASVSMGNHGLLDGGAPVETPVVHAVRIAHYPVRSAAQMETKAALAWTSYVAMGYDGGGLGEHWRLLAESYANGDPAPLRDQAFGFPGQAVPVVEDELIEDPLPYAHQAKYAALAVPRPGRTIARFASQVAGRYAELRAEMEAVRSGLGALETRIAAVEESR